MPDFLTKAERSIRMAAIRSHGNMNTEVALSKLMRRYSITGWRRKQPIYGKPDFVFKSARLAVFVDGCFWHSCPLHSHVPLTNRPFWRKKLLRNQERDMHVTQTLQTQGWKVLRIWEHDLTAKNARRGIARIRAALERARKTLIRP
jgi:DNA mismatch endonuclease (patch repair protein)